MCLETTITHIGNHTHNSDRSNGIMQIRAEFHLGNQQVNVKSWPWKSINEKVVGM